MAWHTSAASRPVAAAPDAVMLQQAAHWFAVMADERRTPLEQAQWQQWLSEHPAHRIAWQRVEHIGSHVETLESASQGRTRHLLDAVQTQGRQRQRRTTLKALLVMMGVGGASWGVGHTAWWQGRHATHISAVGQRTVATLDDGSKMWLNADSRVQVDYQSDVRAIHLLSGEVLIETAPDTHYPPRSMVVHTAQGRIRPLGTVFSVRQAEGATDVAVFEGAVRVRPHWADESKQTILSGQQARFTQHQVQEVVAAQAARQSWRDGVLLADGMRLDQLLSELDRYRTGWLSCDPEVAALKVVGVFRLDEPESALMLLQQSLPIRVQRVMPGWTRITHA